jgi:hypothetical protein
MAVVAGDEKRFVLAKIPVLHASHIFMACETFRIPGSRTFLFAKRKDGNTSSPAFFNVLVTRAVA